MTRIRNTIARLLRRVCYAGIDLADRIEFTPPWH